MTDPRPTCAAFGGLTEASVYSRVGSIAAQAARLTAARSGITDLGRVATGNHLSLAAPERFGVVWHGSDHPDGSWTCASGLVHVERLIVLPARAQVELVAHSLVKNPSNGLTVDHHGRAHG